MDNASTELLAANEEYSDKPENLLKKNLQMIIHSPVLALNLRRPSVP